MPQKILPHLWFDKEAKEAAEFYVSIGKDAEFCDIDSRLERSVGAVVAFFHRTNFLVAEFNKGDHHERIRVVEQIATEYF